MQSGTTFTALQTTGNIDFAGETSISNITLASGNYLNVPVTFTNVVFDTSDGNININSGQVTTANTTYTLGGTYSGTNKIRFNFNFNFRVSTTIASNNIVNAGTGTLTVLPITGNLTFSGAPTGSRITVFYANGVLAETAITASTTHAFSTAYSLNTELFYRVFASGYQATSGTTTVVLQGVNTVPVSLVASDGYTNNSSVVLRNVNATTVNAAGNISIYTSNNTIVFHTVQDIREGLSTVNREWTRSDLGGTSNIALPVQLDSVKGLEILNGWTVVNTGNTLNEGWVQRAANNAISNVFYRFITENNQYDVNLRLIYDSVEQTPTVYSGTQNRAIEISKTAGNVQIRAKIKHQLIDFIDRTETIRSSNTASYQRFYRNTITNYLEQADESVSQALSLANVGTEYRLNETQFVTDPDENNITHTFSRIIEIGTGVNDRQTMINQFAAIATAEPRYNSKFYTLNANGSVTMEANTWVRYRDASPLSGSLISILQLRSPQGTYVQPESRIITVNRQAGATRDCSYIVYNTTTGNVLVDADGVEVTGNLTANTTTRIWTIIANTNSNIRIAWMGNTVGYNSEDAVLDSDGVTFTVVPNAVDVETPASTQLVDDNINGILAWKNVITNCTFNTTSRVITIPTETGTDGAVIKSYNAAYFYFAWRYWAMQDIRRLRFGQAVFAEHQFRPSGATNNAHMLKPGVYFGDRWKLDVNPNRLTTDIVRLEASALSRRDTTENSGLIYASPLANGANGMAEVIVSGAATQAIADTYNKAVEVAVDLDKVKNLAGWLASNGKLLGLKPMPTEYGAGTNYRDNIDLT